MLCERVTEGMMLCERDDALRKNDVAEGIQKAAAESRAAQSNHPTAPQKQVGPRKLGPTKSTASCGIASRW